MNAPMTAKKPQSPLAAHLKSHNLFVWISAVCSVLMIVLMFLPWLSIPTEQLTAEQTIKNVLIRNFDVDVAKKLESETAFEEDLGIDPADVVKFLEKQKSDFFFNVPEDMKAEFPQNLVTISDMAKVYDVKHYSVTLIPDLLMDTLKNVDLMIFLIPLLLGVVVVHVLYLISLFRPGHDAFYAGTVAMLLVGITVFVFLFAGDAAFSLVSKSTEPESFASFSGISKWTWVPFVWFLIGFVQKLVLIRFAHPKKVAK